MKISEMTNEALFITYMTNKDAIARLYVAQNEIEEQWKKRKQLLKDKFQRGDINMQLDAETLRLLEGDRENEQPTNMG